MKIAISGPAAAGKGTIARRFAVDAKIGYVDLGLLFRVGTFVLSTKKITSLEELPALLKSREVIYKWNEGIASVFLYSEDITTALLSQEIANQTSMLASSHNQQAILTEISSFVLETFDGVICDGRNAGTTILQDADHKFFVTARLEERARRRYLDVIARDKTVSFEEILREINERDKRDAERLENPSVIPSGAIILETDTRTVDESVQFMWDNIKKKS